jgi:ArsR family transcriptional regulator
MKTYIDDAAIEATGSCDSRDCTEVNANDLQAARACVIDGATAKRVAGMFRALSDPTRLRIISILTEREFCVGDLTAVLEMAQPAVSHQLRDMHALQLVQSRREGRHIYYRLDDEHVSNLFRQALAHARHGTEGHNA